MNPSGKYDSYYFFTFEANSRFFMFRGILLRFFRCGSISANKNCSSNKHTYVFIIQVGHAYVPWKLVVVLCKEAVVSRKSEVKHEAEKYLVIPAIFWEQVTLKILLRSFKGANECTPETKVMTMEKHEHLQLYLNFLHLFVFH